MRSKFEENIVSYLKRKNVDFKYETESYEYTLNYKPDFILPNGIIIEAKGYLRPEDKRKMLAVKRSNPDLDIRFLFQNAFNFATKKMTYSAWAEKHGFGWHHSPKGIVPSKWINEKKDDKSDDKKET